MSLLRDDLDAAIECSTDYPAFMWEQAENKLVKRLAGELCNAMMKSCCWRGLDAEPLADILFMGEDHPAVIEEAFTGARAKLETKGALTEELKEALEHSLDFLRNKANYLEARQAESSEDDKELDKLMRKLARMQLCS